MKILLLTKDNKLLLDSTGDAIIVNDNIEMVTEGDNIVIKLKNYYDHGSSDIEVVVDEGEIGYII